MAECSSPSVPGVPPLALTVTIVLAAVAQNWIVGRLAVTALGWLMSPVVVAVQPLASVTV